MNAYRKEHSNGKVTYTSNGAYASGKHYTNKSNAWLYVILFIIALVACVSLMLSVSSVGAAANNTLRSEGCHTYNIFGHQDKITNGIDYKLCGENQAVVHTDKDKITSTNNDSVSTNDDHKITLPDNENVPDESPIVENEPNKDNDNVPTDELGNPGNDKEVGHAGEHCDKGMCEQGDHGNKGKSNSFVPFTALVALWKKLTRKLHWSKEWWITNHLYVATWTSLHGMKTFSIRRHNKVITITLFSHVAIYISWRTDKAGNF